MTERRTQPPAVSKQTDSGMTEFQPLRPLIQAFGKIIKRSRGGQRRQQFQQAREQVFVFTGLYHQLHQIIRQRAYPLTLASELPLHQRDRTFYRVRDGHVSDLRGIADEKIRMRFQIRQHRLLIRLSGRGKYGRILLTVHCYLSSL